MRRFLGFAVTLTPVWAVIAYGTYQVGWWFPLAMAVLFAAVAGFVWLGMWIEGQM